MDARELGHTAKAWRDRRAGRVVFDLSAAEAAIQWVYRASDLPEPNQVLWVKGPREAAQAIAFLESPPRKLRRGALVALVLGAAAWVGLALAIGGSTLAAQPLATTAMWSVVVAVLGLALGVVPRIPLPPGLPATRRDGTPVFVGAAVALGMYLFALGRLGGLSVDPVARTVALSLAASVGTLPGVLFLWRLRRAYAPLPRSLSELASNATVAYRLEGARRQAWAPSLRTIIDPRPDRGLLEAHRHAHRQVFMLHGLTDPRSGVFDRVPPHLDGLEAAPRAAMMDGAGATGPAAAFAELAFYVDRLYPFASIAVAVLPATTVATDAEERPHAENGPALAWADGTQFFAWHGRLVPPEIIDPDRPVTRRRIDRETDLELRWVLTERYGLGRYLMEAGATEIQHDDCGRLYRLSQFLSEPIQAVRVVNHTPEPDGSLREFWLRVPPTIATARQAVAWTFDLPTEDYDPVAQS